MTDLPKGTELLPAADTQLRPILEKGYSACYYVQGQMNVLADRVRYHSFDRRFFVGGG